MIVTTSHKFSCNAEERAIAFAAELNCAYIPRANRSLPSLLALAHSDRALVVEGADLGLVHYTGVTYRYHPNLGFVRALNLLRGQRDLFVEAARIEPGERVLDCTLGFGGEAMLAAILAGYDGTVIGLESVPELALLTREGLRNRSLHQPVLQDAMRRISVVTSSYVEYLAGLEPGKFDLICFDPFFHERIAGSEQNIDPLFQFGDQTPLDVESVLLARQIATRRVLVKHPALDDLPAPLVEVRAEKLTARKRPVAYSIFNTVSDTVRMSAATNPDPWKPSRLPQQLPFPRPTAVPRPD